MESLQLFINGKYKNSSSGQWIEVENSANQGQFTDTAPFGGYKQSGNTREGGLPGFKGFLEMKVIFS